MPTLSPSKNQGSRAGIGHIYHVAFPVPRAAFPALSNPTPAFSFSISDFVCAVAGHRAGRPLSSRSFRAVPSRNPPAAGTRATLRPVAKLAISRSHDLANFRICEIP